MSYQIEILPSARRELAALPAQIRHRVDRAIVALATDPRPSGAGVLRAKKGMLRLRVGDYRIVYQIQEQRLLVVIVRIRHRRDVYRNL